MPDLCNGFVSSPTAAIDNDQGVLHFDYNLNPRDALSFVYVINDSAITIPSKLSTGPRRVVICQMAPVSPTRISLSDRLLHLDPYVLRGKAQRIPFCCKSLCNAARRSHHETSPAELGFTNVNPDDPKGTAPPIMYASSFKPGPSPQGPTKLHHATFEWADNFTWTRGRHELKFGADITRIRQNFHYDFYNNGSFDFDIWSFYETRWRISWLASGTTTISFPKPVMAFVRARSDSTARIPGRSPAT